MAREAVDEDAHRPGGSALVYRGRVDVTALARHTRYFP